MLEEGNPSESHIARVSNLIRQLPGDSRYYAQQRQEAEAAANAPRVINSSAELSAWKRSRRY